MCIILQEDKNKLYHSLVRIECIFIGKDDELSKDQLVDNIKRARELGEVY